MNIKFTKMHGAGNDYIYINGFEYTIDDPNKLAIFASHRNFGIGGDGIVTISPSQNADAFMRMYNADGSEGSMCGNAIRCVAKYLYDNNICKKENISIETISGIKYIEVFVENGICVGAKVDMGIGSFDTKEIAIDTEKAEFIDENITVLGNEYAMTCVSMGNPHAVTFVDSVDDLDLLKIGPHFENYKLFLNRINTEFVEIIDDNTVKMRVYERGSGETLACGTGACAVVCACIKKGILKFDTDNVVKLIGGDLIINVKPDYRVFMTGPATSVFTGEIDV